MIPAQNPSTGEGAPPRFRQLSALCFSAPLLVNGIVLPFFPVWLADHQFSDHQIGTILAVPMVVRVLVAPIVAVFADRMQERAHVLLWSGILSLLTAIALYWTTNFWPVHHEFSRCRQATGPINFLNRFELCPKCYRWVISCHSRVGLDVLGNGQFPSGPS